MSYFSVIEPGTYMIRSVAFNKSVADLAGNGLGGFVLGFPDHHDEAPNQQVNCKPSLSPIPSFIKTQNKKNLHIKVDGPALRGFRVRLRLLPQASNPDKIWHRSLCQYWYSRQNRELWETFYNHFHNLRGPYKKGPTQVRPYYRPWKWQWISCLGLWTIWP